MQDRAEQGMGLNYRRRVVYRALTACFADEGRARRHFSLWNREFADQPHVSLTRFVSAVAREDTLDATARGRLQRALYEGLSLRYEQLQRVPDDWMPAANHTGEFPALPVASIAARTALPAPTSVTATLPAAPTAAALPTERAERVVFRALARPLATAVLEEADAQPGLLRHALAELAQSLDAQERPAHARLTAWADARFIDRDLPVMATLDGYRTLLTLLRRVAADVGGDALADHLLAAALVEAGTLPEARVCPPLQLI